MKIRLGSKAKKPTFPRKHKMMLMPKKPKVLLKLQRKQKILTSLMKKMRIKVKSLLARRKKEKNYQENKDAAGFVKNQLI